MDKTRVITHWLVNFYLHKKMKLDLNESLELGNYQLTLEPASWLW